MPGFFDQNSEYVVENLRRQMTATFERTTPTTGVVRWNVPDDTTNFIDDSGFTVSVATGVVDFTVYLNSFTRPRHDGYLILAATQEMTPGNYPTNGQTYTAATNIATPASMIANAIVVGAFYANTLVDEVSITGLNSSSDYYFTVHPLTDNLYYHAEGVLTYNPVDIRTEAFTGDVPSYDMPPTAPVLGQVYYSNTNGKVYMWGGASWVEASMYDTIAGRTYPDNVLAGQFFYNTVTKGLYVYDGTNWNIANTENKGKNISSKIGIGTDGSSDEYKELSKNVKLQLGWPQQCMELREENFNLAINNALAAIRQRTDNAYSREYFYVRLKKGQASYYLNDPVTGTNRVADVIKVHRLGPLSALPTGGGDNLYSQAFMSMFFANGDMDSTTFHLVTAFSKHLQRMMAGDIAFAWRESHRELTVFRNMGADEHAIVEVACEKTAQELIVDRYLNQWIQDWTESECLFMLGQIRSKFGSLPGPNGGLTLNGDYCLSRASEMQTDLVRQITDYEVGNGTTFGNSTFLIG